MITKEQYIGALTHELNVVKHLAAKVKPEQLSYKPTDKQRTLGELMQYLSYVTPAFLDAITKNDMSVYMKHHDAASMPTLENFGGLIDTQIAQIPGFVSPLTDEDMNKEVKLFMSRTIGMWLIFVLQNITAYKMQMFLYMKASGTENIGTSNVWSGADPEIKEDKEA
jgi:hypothetical protein